MRSWQGWRIAVLMCATACCGAEAGAQRDARKLRDVLEKERIPADQGALPNLDKNITSAAAWNDAGEYVIAYYIYDTTNRLFPPMYIDRYDKSHGKWESAKIDEATAEAKGVDTPCLGSVLSMHRVGEHLLVDTHINPSAGCTLIVDGSLQLKAGLYGWFLGALGKNSILYQRSQIHFAPVHATEIALYDLATGRDATVFPEKPDQAIRAQVSKKVREFRETHEDWCKAHNDPCDPDWIESGLVGEVAVNTATDAAAFVMSYQNENGDGEIRKPDGPKEVLYVYRHVSDPAKHEFREKLLEDAKREFQVKEVRQLLEAETLKKLFE